MGWGGVGGGAGLPPARKERAGKRFVFKTPRLFLNRFYRVDVAVGKETSLVKVWEEAGGGNPIKRGSRRWGGPTRGGSFGAVGFYGNFRSIQKPQLSLHTTTSFFFFFFLFLLS